MKVKIVGISHYVRTVNDREYDNYTVYFIRRPFSDVYTERDIEGFVADSKRGGAVFKDVKIDKCYDLVEAQVSFKDGHPVYGVVDVSQIDKI